MKIGKQKKKNFNTLEFVYEKFKEYLKIYTLRFPFRISTSLIFMKRIHIVHG